MLVAGLSPWRLGFDPGPVHAGFVVDKLAMGTLLLRVLRFYPVITPPMPHTYPYLHVTLIRRLNWRILGSLPKSNAFSENRGALYRRNFHFCRSRRLLAMFNETPLIIPHILYCTLMVITHLNDQYSTVRPYIC
jgi:hypothetical protein